MNKKSIQKEKKCRCKKCISFRKEYPFDFLDIYGLHYHLSRYIYPRLEAFRDHTYSNPIGLSSKKWTKTINKMIFAFKLTAQDDIIKEED